MVTTMFLIEVACCRLFLRNITSVSTPISLFQSYLGFFVIHLLQHLRRGKFIDVNHQGLEGAYLQTPQGTPSWSVCYTLTSGKQK